MSGVHLITVPFNAAGLTSGRARMPAALEAAGLVSAIGPSAVTRIPIDGLTTRRGPSGLIAEEALSAMVRALAGAIDAAVPTLVVAGDCPALLGALVALGPECGLVFVDGHEDAWMPTPQLSGEASDSELGLAIGTVPAPAGLADLLPAVDPSHVLALGARDLAEIESFGAATIRDRIALRDDAWLVDAEPAALVELAESTAGSAPGGWWLHVDLDVLSTEALPAVDYPQDGGLTWERLEGVTEALLSIPGCQGASIVIYNPDLDGGAAAPRIVRYAELVAEALSAGRLR